MDAVSSENSRPRKRQRVSRACDNCRNRKTACDGRRPICMACESRADADSCSYNFVPLRQSQSGLWHADSELGRSEMTKSIQNGSRVEERRVSRPELTPESQQLSHAPLLHAQPKASPLEEVVEAAPRDGLATFAGDGDQAAYGPSSTVSFLRHVLAKGSRPPTPNGHVEHAESTRAFERPESVRPMENSHAVLPLRRNADDFLACYWEFIHPVFPLLHRPTFVDQYERLWASERGKRNQPNDIEEPIFMATLNLVFALGCKLSNLIPPTEKTDVADSFYQQARGLSHHLIFDSTSIATVQLLAVSAVYLQSTQYATRCWNAAGLAIRAAQSLGLHAEAGGKRQGSQLEREMRRRVWHVCVSLDRLLCMTFGRPAMVRTPTDVPLPSMIDDEYLSISAEGHQPPGKHSRLGAFVNSCQLFELLGQVLDFLSSPLLQSTFQAKALSGIGDLLFQVRELNRKLDSFSESVPEYLRKSDRTSLHTTAHDNHTHLQQRVLHCRFMLVRLLLLRPLLLMSTRMPQSRKVPALDDTTQSTLDAELVRNYCSLCLNTAYRLVDVIYYNLNTLYRSAGWHAVYFASSSAIVLLASLKCPLVEIRTENEMFENCWTRCMAVFEHYRDQIPSAAHAVHVLRAIRSQIAQGNDTTTTLAADLPGSELATTSTTSPTAPPAQDVSGSEPCFDDLDLWGFNNMSDAWFGQQLINLDWLELPEV